MALPVYEVYALKYARRDARRHEHFVGGDPHDAPMHMDYFVWLIRNAERTIVVDTGFTAEVAAKRKREYIRTPKAALALMGVNADEVKDVVITHMHYDHVGTFFDFPAATFHIQDEEMKFATGRHMRHARFAHSVEVEDVIGMVRALFRGRLAFHNGDEEIAPGISLHHIGGHTPGLQSVRVHTKRGWVVVASDATHYYEHFETGRCFVSVVDIYGVLEGYDKLRRLADSDQHVVPGHDPLVMARYPAVSKELEGIAVRLDEPPVEARAR
jgi:glyoxylase-like metal-dependent hydrolase (beta-lactamase superfamily II)